MNPEPTLLSVQPAAVHTSSRNSYPVNGCSPSTTTEPGELELARKAVTLPFTEKSAYFVTIPLGLVGSNQLMRREVEERAVMEGGGTSDGAVCGVRVCVSACACVHVHAYMYVHVCLCVCVCVCVHTLCVCVCGGVARGKEE